jgi:hypothetical protein
MDIFFQDPTEIPLPPEEVRIRQLQAKPWPDQRRVKVYLEVDPFQERPSAQVQILNTQGETMAEVSVVETMTRKMELNMHLRQQEPEGEYQVQVILYYQQLPPVGETEPEPPQQLPARLIVDQKQTIFNLPA